MQQYPLSRKSAIIFNWFLVGFPVADFNSIKRPGYSYRGYAIIKSGTPDVTPCSFRLLASRLFLVPPLAKAKETFLILGYKEIHSKSDF